MVGNEICYQNIFLWGRGIVHKAVVCRQEFCILPCFSIPRSSLFERIVWLASFIAFLPSKLSHFIFFPSIFLFFTKPQNPVTFSSFNFSPPFSPSFSHFPLLPSILEIIVFQPIHLRQTRPLPPSVPLTTSSISLLQTPPLFPFPPFFPNPSSPIFSSSFDITVNSRSDGFQGTNHLYLLHADFYYCIVPNKRPGRLQNWNERL